VRCWCQAPLPIRRDSISLLLSKEAAAFIHGRDSAGLETTYKLGAELREVESKILSEQLRDAPYFQHSDGHKGLEQCFLLLAMVRA
jgi:hypothetical protein